VAFCSKDNKHDKDCQYYAEGDEVSQPDDGSNGVEVADNTPVTQDQGEDADQPQEEDSPSVQAPIQSQAQPTSPAPDEEQDEEEPAQQDQQEAQPQGNLQDYAPGQSNAQALTSIATPTAQELYQQHLQSAADLAANPIHAKNMQDLFAEKSTLGKIGTMFGLMVGGMGSGLSHQPNAALAMMQNQINNDLQAQQSSKTGAQNFLNMANMYQSQQMQNKLTAAQIAQIPLQNALTQANTGMLNKQKDLLTVNVAKANMLLGAMPYLQNNYIDPLPNGQGKIAAQSMLDGTIKPAVNQQLQTDATATANKVNMVGAIHGSQEGPPPPPSVNNLPPDQMDAQIGSTLTNLRNMGMMDPAFNARADQLEAHYVPGVGVSVKTIDQAGRDRIQGQQLLNQSLQNFRQAINNLTPQDYANPAKLGDLAIKHQSVLEAYAKALGAAPGAENLQMINNLLPKGNELLPSVRVNPLIDSIDQDNQTKTNVLLNGYGFGPGAASKALKKSPQQQAQQQQAPQLVKGQIYRDPSTGKRYSINDSGVPEEVSGYKNTSRILTGNGGAFE
jgi:hypothetical protein